MLIVDIILVAVLVLALAAGASRGFFGSIGSIAGFVAGAVALYWVVPLVNQVWPWQQWRIAALIGVTILLLVTGATIGGAIGNAMRRGVERTPLRGIDRFLGAVVGVIAGALAITLTGTSLAAIGMPGVSSALSSSVVMRTIEQLTPEPVARALAEVRGAVVDEGLPALGNLLTVGQAPSIGAIDLDDPELAAAGASVARVSGTAFACGTSSTGTGFVIAADRIVTNAHVVAGVEVPLVELPGVAAREGRIVYFDPIDDLAVIAVDDLGATPLPLADTLPVGTAAAFEGYPLGGPFTLGSAGVLAVATVPVPDIYDSSSTAREIYALQAVVRPGNSGGPLLTDAGEVSGVVFARDLDDESRGYAMTMAELDPVAAQASSLTQAVSSGGCIG